MSTITSIHEHAVEIDTRLAETYKHLSDIEYSIERAESAIRRATGQTYRHGQWDGTLHDALLVTTFVNQWDARGHEEGIKSLNDLRPVRDSLNVIIDACNADWRDNGRWSRFYLVTNTNGHIHSSLSCSTCFHDTNFAWLTHLSGLDEADAVQAEGEVLCTICYPSAPVSWTNGISRRDKEAKAKREAEKAERQRIKAEKSLSINGDVVSIRTDPKEGSRYYGHKEFKTLRSAELWLVEAYTPVLIESWKALGDKNCWSVTPDAFSPENHALVLDLYLKKTGKAYDDVVPAFLKKAEKKARGNRY
jgi:hypothetical protein